MRELKVYINAEIVGVLFETMIFGLFNILRGA